jgi:hypothetical protein
MRPIRRFNLIVGVWLSLGVGCATAQAGDAQYSWKATLNGACARCVSASSERTVRWADIPEHAVIYSFTGEFAHQTRWAMVNLDNGLETTCLLNLTTTSTSIDSCDHKLVDDAALGKLRIAAARLWQSAPLRPNEISIAPGTAEEAYVIAGRRMVSFSRWIKSQSYIISSLKAALGDADVSD